MDASKATTAQETLPASAPNPESVANTGTEGASPTDAQPASAPAEEPTAESPAEPQAEQLPTEPQAEPQTEQPAAEPQPETVAEPQPETAAEPQTEQQPEPQPETQPEPQPEPQPETQPETAATIELTPAASEEASEEGADLQRSGAYFGLGFGLGGSGFMPKALLNGSAFNMSMRFGYAAHARWLMGLNLYLQGQYRAWKENTPISTGISTALFEIQSFPFSSNGLNLCLAAGWTSLAKYKRLENVPNTSLPAMVSETDQGPAYAAALGYDFSMDDGYSFGLQARYDGSNMPNLNIIHSGSLNLLFNWY